VFNQTDRSSYQRKKCTSANVVCHYETNERERHSGSEKETKEKLLKGREIKTKKEKGIKRKQRSKGENKKGRKYRKL
jgi:hypothetical protein